MEEIILCDYRCGRPAIKRFKNGKYCCSEDVHSCPTVRRKSSISHSGKKRSPHKEETKRKIGNSGRGKKRHTLEFKEKKRQEMLSGGSLHAHKNITKESLRKRSKTIKENKEFIENLRKEMINSRASYMNSIPRDPEKMEKLKEELSKVMKRGRSAQLRKLIKRTSRGELKLRGIVKDLYHTAEHTYSILNYDVDNALLEFKIAIEYDGYYHFDTEDHKEYHKKRQKEIEEDGWKFLRYTMFDKFPTKEKVEKDIEKLISK